MWTKPGDEGSLGIHTSRGGKEVQTLSGNTIYRRKISFVFEFIGVGGGGEVQILTGKGKGCSITLADWLWLTYAISFGNLWSRPGYPGGTGWFSIDLQRTWA